MKKLLVLALGMVFLLGAGGRLLAQPEATGYTLSDIYYYLAEGTQPTWGNHSLEPQSGVPGQDIAGFSQSMEDIVYYMAEAFGQCNLTADDLAGKGYIGKVFFATSTTGWGPVTVIASPTPTSTPTPTPSPTPLDFQWYLDYGPSGTGDVVEIGSMYVASEKEGTGCARNGTKNWASACSWGTELDWLGKTDWRLTSTPELRAVCQNTASLGSFETGNYWSSRPDSGGGSDYIKFPSSCGAGCYYRTSLMYVRAVRTGL